MGYRKLKVNSMERNYFVSDIPLMENGDFVIYGDKEIVDYAKEVMEYLVMKKKEILDFFGLDSFMKVGVVLYKDKEYIVKYREQFGPFYYKVGKNSGFFEYDRVLCYSDFTKVSYDEAKRNVCHEFVHLVYQNAVQERINNARIVWVDEGLATYLSGQNDEMKDRYKFKEWYDNQVRKEGKEIPDISFLMQHGSDYGYFCDTVTNKYNGYVYGYLMIRYLVETMDKDELQAILRSKNRLLEIGEGLPERCVNYFNQQLNNGRSR